MYAKEGRKRETSEQRMGTKNWKHSCSEFIVVLFWEDPF